MEALKNFMNRDVVFIFLRYQIMMNCWLCEPESRPSFTVLTKQLKEMENQHEVRFFVEKHTPSINFHFKFVLFNLKLRLPGPLSIAVNSYLVL